MDKKIKLKLKGISDAISELTFDISERWCNIQAEEDQEYRDVLIPLLGKQLRLISSLKLNVEMIQFVQEIINKERREQTKLEKYVEKYPWVLLDVDLEFRGKFFKDIEYHGNISDLDKKYVLIDVTREDEYTLNGFDTIEEVHDYKDEYHEFEDEQEADMMGPYESWLYENKKMIANSQGV